MIVSAHITLTHSKCVSVVNILTISETSATNDQYYQIKAVFRYLYRNGLFGVEGVIEKVNNKVSVCWLHVNSYIIMWSGSVYHMELQQNLKPHRAALEWEPSWGGVSITTSNPWRVPFFSHEQAFTVKNDLCWRKIPMLFLRKFRFHQYFFFFLKWENGSKQKGSNKNCVVTSF